MGRAVIEERSERIDYSKLRPTQDHVLLKALRREKSSGGIWLSGNSATAAAICEVVALGQGVQDWKTGQVYPFELEAGDFVIVMEYTGQKMELRDGDFRLVRSPGIWAKVRMKNFETYEIAEIEPRGQFLVVEPDDETKTRSGLLFFPNAENRESEGRLATVVKAGPGLWTSGERSRSPLEVRAGQRIVMVRFAGEEIRVGGRWLRIINETDVKCVVEEE